ncbi:hypothetical protein SLA2020_143930 [Shorea laevis]
MDWRDKPVLAPVVNQLNCDCCWAIVAANSISSAQSIKFNREVTVYSYQQLIDCANPAWDTTQGYDCIPYCYRKAYRHIITNGLCKAEDYKWEKKRQPCQLSKKLRRYDVLEDYENIKNNEEEVLNILKQQPVAARVGITEPLRRFVGNGIFAEGGGSTKGHAVLIVGYGEEEGQKYYIIQNSWGTSWGEDGFGKINRKLLRHFSYPVVKEGLDLINV